MQVSVETTGTLGRRMTIAIPAEEVEKEIKQRLQRLAKNARLPGFRPGRAPLRVIEAKYGGQVLGEVAGSLIESSLRQALSQEQLVPAGGPDVEPKTLERGKDLEYVASFDVYPEVKQADLKGTRIKRPECQVSDADVDKTIESMRKQRTSWEPVQRAAQQGDQLIMDFSGTIDGEPFTGGQAEGYAYELGSGKLLEDFEQGLAGSGPEEEKDIKVRFPDDYHGADVAGKEAVFAVRVKSVNAPRLPEMDAEFARSFGVEDGNIEKLRQDVRNNIQREVDDRIKTITRQRVLDALITANEIEVPAKLLEQEIDRMIESNRQLLAQQGIPTAEAQPDRGRFTADAQRRVALGLILYEIVRQHDITADPDRVRERIEQLSVGYEDPKAFVQWYYSDKQRLAQMESLVMEEQVVEQVLNSAEVQEQSLSFEELMQTAA